MATADQDKPKGVTRPPRLPAPTTEQRRTVSQTDIEDEQRLRDLADHCFQAAENETSLSSGPKWMAEGLKAMRLARVIRDQINQLEYSRELMEHERVMAGLGRRSH